MNFKPGTKEYRLTVEEKGCCGELNTIGKIAYFIETFYGIKLEDKDIREVLPVAEPTKTISFQSGYKNGKALVDNGFTKEHYLEFYKNTRTKIKEKLDSIEITKKLK